jgi:hypothetical protein
MNDRRYATGSAILAILLAAALAAEPVAADAQAAAQGYDQTPAPPPSDGYPQGALPQNPGPPPQDANVDPAQGQYPAGPQGYGQPQSAPPPYAQPPGGAQAYNYQAYQQAYRDWQIRYAQWFRHNCVNQHARNTAAGALIGGGFGALLAAAVAGPWAVGGWALFGGVTGAATGAAIASSVRPSSCPAPRYHYYGGPPYGPPWGWPGYYPPYGYGPPGPHPY